MNEAFVKRIAKEVTDIQSAGLFKKERIISSPQGVEIEVNGKNSIELLRQ